MNTLVATLWTALTLYLLYKTDVVFSYLSSPLLSWLNPITKVKQITKEFDGMSYSEFMCHYHNNFLVKMISCRYCFGFWVALAAALAIGKIEATPITYFGGQLLCTAFDFCERKLHNE